MKFSEIFGFLTILNESIKLLPKNWKFTASILTLLLLIPSILFVSFISFREFSMNEMTASIMNPSSTHDYSDYNPVLYMLKYLVPLLAIEIAFLLVFLTITHLSGIAIVLVSYSSYTGNKLSLQDLLSSIKKKWRRPLSTSFRVTGRSAKQYLVIIVGIFASSVLLSMYRNPITISVAIILWIIIFIFQLYASVVWSLSGVVSVVEEMYLQGEEVTDRAEQLVQGQRVHGFMLNLFVNLMFVITYLVCWLILGDKGSMNLTIYGLVFLNSISVLRILILMAHIVFYFRCKKHHGEGIEIVGDLHYTKLPTIGRV